MKKRIVGVILTLTMVVAMASGCGNTSSETKDASSDTSSTTPSTLTMPVSATVTSLNPILETMAEGTIQLAPFSDPLYVVDQGETRFYLADSCAVSEDGLVYTLKLKDGLKWHDGEPITADDVVFTAECCADTNNGTGYTNVVFLGDKEIKVEKVDDLTVTFTLPEVSASYYEILGKITIIPAHAFDGNTEIVSADANLTDIGSGPYKLTEFKDGESLVLEEFDDYYGGAPQIDSVVFKVISDPSSQEVAFKNGEINYLKIASDDVAEELEKMDGVTVHSVAEGRVKYLAWNKYCDTWKDRDAVKAVFYALNQDEIVEGAYGKYMGTPANSIFSNCNLFYDANIKGYTQNLDEAKKLAESSGLAGKTITLYYNTDRTFMETTALLIQQQLKAIDVNVDVQGVNANGFFDVVFSDQADYELYLNEYGTTGDPDTVISGMFDGTWGINVDASQKILDLFKKGRETVDTEERAKIYTELQQTAVDEFLTYPIAYPSWTYATTSNLEGTEVITTTPLFEDYTKLYFK